MSRFGGGTVTFLSMAGSGTDLTTPGFIHWPDVGAYIHASPASSLVLFNDVEVANDLTVTNDLDVLNDINVTGTVNGATIAASSILLPISVYPSGGVIFPNGSGTLTNNASALFWDNANERLGIGTNTPTVDLDVNGNVRFTGNLEVGGTIDTALTQGQILFPDSSGVLTGESNLFWDASNNRLGILTNAPTTPFSVKNKVTIDPTVADSNAAPVVNIDTDNAFTTTGFGSTAGATWLRLLSNGTLRYRIDWGAGNALRHYSPGRLDFESAGQIFFTGTQGFFQFHTSFNRTGDASSTATQKDSYGLYIQHSGWTGAASTQRFALIRNKASTTVNLDHYLLFAMNITGGVGTEGTEAMRIYWDNTNSWIQTRFSCKYGYHTGQGGTVTQATDKSTGVTLSKLTGDITMNNATLNADTTVSFTLTNTLIEANDYVMVQHVSGGTVGSYTVSAVAAAGSAVITVRNITTGNLGEAIVIKFFVQKAVVA